MPQTEGIQFGRPDVTNRYLRQHAILTTACHIFIVVVDREDGDEVAIPEAVVDAGIPTQEGMSYLAHL
jgi:hypothetical protein